MIAMAVNSLLCEAMRNFVVGVIGHLRGDISEAEALGPDELLIAHDADDDAGERSIRDLSVHPRGKEPLGAKHFGVVGDSHVGGGRLFHCGWIRAGLWVR